MVETAKKTNYYQQVKRNRGFITEQGQEKIRKTHLVLLGCGLGSVIAENAVRSGFENFTLIDGDVVEESNLNRQKFDQRHIGENKAKITGQNLKAINPEINLKVIPEFIEEGDELSSIIDPADIVVNMAEPQEIMYEVNRKVTKAGKYTIFPLNIGYGGLVLIFSKSSKSLEEILGGERAYGPQFYLKLLGQLELGGYFQLPDYLRKKKEKLEKEGELENSLNEIPQLGCAADHTTSLVVSSAIKIAKGDPIKQSPEVIHFDSYAEEEI